MKPNEIINNRINQILSATNKEELINYEYFAHGSAVTMWELEIFTKQEHTENYDRIVKAKKERLAQLEKPVFKK